MEIATLSCNFQCLLLIPWGFRPRLRFQLPPFFTVATRNQWVVILQELPKRDKDLAHVDDPFDAGIQPFCCSFIIDPENIPVPEADCGSFYRIYRHHTARLAGALGLHLRSGCKKLPEDMQGSRVEAGGSKTGIPRTPVPQPESSFPHGVRKHRSPADKITEVFVQGFNPDKFFAITGF